MVKILHSLLFLNFVFGRVFPADLISNRLREIHNVTTVYGDISVDASARSRMMCAAKCLKHDTCKGMLFNTKAAATLRCNHVWRGGTTYYWGQPITQINVYQLDAGDSFYCVNPYNLMTTAGEVTCWDSGPPVLYFTLDSDDGIALGLAPSNVRFVDGGVVGRAFYNPTDGSVISYYSLGNYSPDKFCFVIPNECLEGVTFALWIKILSSSASLGDPSYKQGIITTMTSNGPGFSLYWYDYGLRWWLRRKDATTHQWRSVSDEHFFESGCNFGAWCHYVHAFASSNSVYGLNRAHLNWKPAHVGFASQQFPVATYSAGGALEIGHVHIGENAEVGNIMLDEIMVWETLLTEEDMVKLYHIYDV